MGDAVDQFDLEGLVKRIVPEPMRSDFCSEPEAGDARNTLVDNLRDYHTLVEQVPEHLRPLLAKVVTSALAYGSDPTIDINFRDSDLPGKYAEVLTAYHALRGIPVPRSDDEEEVQGE